MFTIYLATACMFVAAIGMVLHSGSNLLGTSILLGLTLPGIILGHALRTWAHKPVTLVTENRMTIVVMVILVIAVVTFTWELCHPREDADQAASPA